MKTRKLIWMLVFVQCISVSFCGCTALSSAKGIDNGTPRKFGSTYMTMNNPYFDVLNDGIKEVVEANGDILITRDPAQDQEKQNNQIYDMIEEGVAAIFLNPVDWKEVKPALIACDKADIPVFNVDTYVCDTEYVVSVIASDNYNAGVQCAKDMMSKLDSADIIVLDEPIVDSINQRLKGFTDTINGNPKFNIVIREAAGGELEVAMDVMNKIIEKNVDFDVVMGGNDPTAIGAIAALESQHKDKKVLIYGVDGSPDGKMMIKEGYLEGTSAQQPSEIGTIAAEVAYDYLSGKEVEENIVVPVTLITRDNLEKFAIDGWE